MNAVERIAILDAKSRQRVHVKKSPIVDFAGRKLPVRQPVVLPLQQMMQGLGRRGPVRPGAVGFKALIDRSLRRRRWLRSRVSARMRDRVRDCPRPA